MLSKWKEVERRKYPIAISHFRYLAPDPEVVIGNKLRGGVGTLVSHAEGVHVPEDDDGDGSKEESLLPNLKTTFK